MQEFRTVRAWQMAHQITLDVYALTESFPKAESFGLVMQMRRAALNPPMRIAEACGQDQPIHATRALGTARAAQVELEYLLLLSRDLALLPEEKYSMIQRDLVQARMTLSGFMRAVGAGQGGLSSSGEKSV